MISLLDFVRTGKLGKIGLNASREEVQECFGVPPVWDVSDSHLTARIWKYGSWEIYFQDERVWMIFTDDLWTPLHMGDMAFDSCDVSGRMNEEQVKMWFSSRLLEFTRSPYAPCDKGVRYELLSGVTFTFCADDKADMAFLRSLALTRR